MRQIALSILAIFIFWVGGFGYYLYVINSYKTSNNTTDAIVVFADGDHRIESAIALLKAGYAPILFITGIEPLKQFKNLLKANNIPDQQVIYAPNKIMLEEDYIAKTIDFITTRNLTSARVVVANYNMPFVLREINKRIPRTRPIYIVPNPVFTATSKQYDILINSYNRYLISVF